MRKHALYKKECTTARRTINESNTHDKYKREQSDDLLRFYITHFVSRNFFLLFR